MWETPPLIAGGTWTACYHLVRNLRRRGAHVTVVVPWDRSIILRNPFGSEVPMVVLGIVPPDDTGSAYGEATPAWSPYGRGQAAAGYGSWSPYGGSGTRLWSVYGGIGGGAPYSPYRAERGDEGQAGCTLPCGGRAHRRRAQCPVGRRGTDRRHGPL
jgi:hypothetical protein